MKSKNIRSLKVLIKRKIFFSIISSFLILLICMASIYYQSIKKLEKKFAQKNIEKAFKIFNRMNSLKMSQRFDRKFYEPNKTTDKHNKLRKKIFEFRKSKKIIEEVAKMCSMTSISILNSKDKQIVFYGHTFKKDQIAKIKKKSFLEENNKIITSKKFKLYKENMFFICEYKYSYLNYNKTLISYFFISIIVIILFAMAISNKVSSTIEDLDEKNKQLSEIYRQRAEEWRTISAHIAHEIRNPLSGIKMFSELLERKYKKKEPENEYIENIIDQVDNLNNILTNFLNFSRPPKLKFEVNNIENCIRSTAKSIGRLENKISVIIENKMKKEFLFDFNQMKQVFINIFKNSCDAMKESEIKKMKIKIDNDSSFVNIYIEDTGCGIDEEILSKIFHPFVTDKTTGTGLGLSIVSGIIRAHDGNIEMGNIKEKGAFTNIKIPFRKM